MVNHHVWWLIICHKGWKVDPGDGESHELRLQTHPEPWVLFRSSSRLHLLLVEAESFSAPSAKEGHQRWMPGK